MNRKKIAFVGAVITFVLMFQSCKDPDITAEKSATITALNCANVTFSASATSGTSYTATATVPYTGGNGAAYPEGTAVASSGVTGLTAKLSAGTLENGSGSASFVITGTPSAAGTANFSIDLGGQTCTLALVVAASKASVASLVGTVTPATATSGVAYSGSATLEDRKSVV